MPPKTQIPPPLKSAETSTTVEDRILKTNPEIDRRLDGFMQANSKLTEYYTKLVNENPDRAVRSFMLGKMMRYEAEQRTATRLAPQAKEWLEKQSPEVQQRVHEKIERYSPMYREKAAVRIIGEEKARLDFNPKQSTGQAVSV
jgi:hypothetical protein